MKIYVETNFVMELVLDQEQSGSCEQILALCAQGRVQLVLPAYSLAEPHEKLVRNRKQRKFACFLNRNSKDFDTPDIVAALRSLNCRMIPQFDQGLRFVQAQLQREN